MKRNKLALALIVVLVIIVSTWGGIVLADDNWSTGYAEVSGNTLDLNPSTMSIVSRTCSSLTVHLVKSVDAPTTLVRYSDTASPALRTDGYTAYDGTVADFTFSPTHPVGLVGGHIYYLTAWGYSDNLGWSVGHTHVTDWTLPCDPKDLVATVISDTRIDLSWTKGVGGDTTVMFYKVGSHPTSRADVSAVLCYVGTGTSCSVTGLTAGLDYFFRAWSYDTH